MLFCLPLSPRQRCFCIVTLLLFLKRFSRLLVFLSIQRKAFNITSNQYLFTHPHVVPTSFYILSSMENKSVTNMLCFVYTYIYAHQRCIYLARNTVQTNIVK